MIKTQKPQKTPVRLEVALLGSPHARLEGRAMGFRTRKTLALLAYLALEDGWHARDKLVALLWPEADEGAGRASLRSALAHLNRALQTRGGGEPSPLSARREAIKLEAETLDLDVRRLEAAFRAAGNETDALPELERELETAAARYRGEFLEGFSLPDTPEFDDWVTARRELARQWLDLALERLSELQAASGRIKLALETAQRRVRLEPLNESAHQGVIALHLRSGHRTAALEAYRACKLMLETELGLEPSAQTEALLERPAPSLEVRVVSRAVEGSTRLVGRQREWAAMEAAWQAGQHIFIAGEPGAGKTRLIFEFAATKGAFAQQFGRPGDQAVPFSSITRGIRHALEAHPKLELPDWVRRELSRLIPEQSDAALAPLSSREDRLRLFDAVNRFFEALRDLGLYPLGDDFQFVDDSSMELIAYMIANGPTSFLVSSLAAFRPDEISVGFKKIVQQMVEAGHAVLIELEPLGPQEVGEMLTGLMPESANRDQLGLGVHRFTGGNPMFVLETVRALREQGSLETLTPERFENRRRALGLIRSPKVGAVIARRLDRLSGQARDLARIAAVMGEEFTFERASGILETNPLELARTGEELEHAQLWRGSRFSHDLVLETVIEGIPKSVRSVLHGAVLDALKGSGVPVAVRAGHAFVANRWKEAFRYSLDAAEFARGVYALREGIEHCERARHLLQNPPPGFDPRTDIATDQLVRLYNALLDLRYSINELEVMAALDQEMLEYARQTENPSLECHALVHLAGFQNEWRLSDVERSDFLNAALRIAEDHHLEQEAVKVQVGLVELDINQRRFQTAIERGRRVLSLAREVNGPYVTTCLMWMAQAQLHAGDWEQAEVSYRELLSLTDARDQVHSAHYCLWLGHLAVNQGRVQEGTELMRSSTVTLVELLPDDPYYGYNGGALLAFGLIDCGELGEALRILERHRIRVGENIEAPVCLPVVKALLVLGQLELALDLALRGLEQNASMIGRSAFAPLYADQLGSLACELEVYRGRGDSAIGHAREAANARFKIDGEVGENGAHFSRWLEIEALLRGGEIELAQESVRRLGEFAGQYVRRQILHLRSLSVLEAWDQNLTGAIQHLEEARALMMPMGLPVERWTLEAKLAELYGLRGDLESAIKAQDTALEIVDSLAAKIPDGVMSATFLEFARAQVVSRAELPAI